MRKPKKVILAAGLCCALVVLAAVFFCANSINLLSNLPVTVAVPINSVTFVDIPYLSATNKPLTETEVLEVKRAIPKTRVLLGFYRPHSLVIYSSQEVRAVFFRRTTNLEILLLKTNGTWTVKDISRGFACGEQTSYVGEFFDKVSKASPF